MNYDYYFYLVLLFLYAQLSYFLRTHRQDLNFYRLPAIHATNDTEEQAHN